MSYLLIALLLLAAGAVAVARYAIVFPRQPFHGPLPALTYVQHTMIPHLKAHIVSVASRPHNIQHYGDLDAAARYIEQTLEDFGLNPTLHGYTADGHPVRNIEVVIEPEVNGASSPAYVIGAHYDSPDDSPGANDNGTGVACLIELARSLRQLKPKSHRLRLVFFVNEEHPYGQTPDMGSYRHAEHLKDSGERVDGMIALETLGYFRDRPGTQAFPFPFGLVYPDTGNFVAFVGLPGSRPFLRRALTSFRTHAAFPSIGGVAPGFINGIDLSDHWAYHQFGFPAVMVTDTAPFRNPYYHQADDLPENVDYESLARITTGLEKVIRELVA